MAYCLPPFHYSEVVHYLRKLVDVDVKVRRLLALIDEGGVTYVTYVLTPVRGEKYSEVPVDEWVTLTDGVYPIRIGVWNHVVRGIGKYRYASYIAIGDLHSAVDRARRVVEGALTLRV